LLDWPGGSVARSRTLCRWPRRRAARRRRRGCLAKRRAARGSGPARRTARQVTGVPGDGVRDVQARVAALAGPRVGDRQWGGGRGPGRGGAGGGGELGGGVE